MSAKLIGSKVKITDKKSQYYNHWGYIISYDDSYHISGGSISSSAGEIVPIFDRNQFKLIRSKK